MPSLTVFTPSFNRAHTLPRTYASLVNQTCKDFEWLIIDDGSNDNTSALVQGWISERKIPIHYVYQQNQGMHGAHNTAYKIITTELNTCIDSDDYMPVDAIEKILTIWASCKDDKVAGIIGLDVTESGRVIGSEFACSGEIIDRKTAKIIGDKKLVIRTDVINKYPEYPIFPGEKYVGLGYKYQLIDQDYLWLTLNEPLVVVDYQEDGSSYNMFRQWWNNPRGFAFIHNNDLKYIKALKRRLQVATHYVSHCLRASSPADIFKSNAPILTILCILPGCVLYLYTAFMVRIGAKMIR